MNLRGVARVGCRLRDPDVHLHGHRSSGWRPGASSGCCPAPCRTRPARTWVSAPRVIRARFERAGRWSFLVAAGVLVRLCGADRCRGDQQRRARLPQAEEQERGDHAGCCSAPSRSRWLVSILFLANVMKVRFAENPATQLTLNGVPVGEDYHPGPDHRADGDRGSSTTSHPASTWSTAATGVILVLAANTAFNGFPVLASILARDGYLPRQLHTRGDRLAFSNGIIILAGFAIVLIVAFNAEVTRLIQLYIVGVFVSFTISQTGMVRHWTRLLRDEQDPGQRRPDEAVPGDQHDRPDADRHCAGHRADHQVPARRLHRDHRDGGAVHADEGHPPALRHGWQADGGRG